MTIMTGYLYDAEGRRVSKGTISAWSCDPVLNGFQPTDDHILDLAGEQVTEMGVGGTSDGSTTSGLVWHHTNVWAAGKLLATYDGDSATTSGLHFYFNDPLGTRRVQTDLAGNIEQKCSSLPFGDGETCGPTPTENLFTGKERDSESGNDYFEARYYSSAMGRFMSPDWSAKEDPVPYAQLDDPQSLNLYSYVRNNPLTRVDADGHCDSNGQNCSLWDHVAGTVGGVLNVVPGTVNLGIDAFNAVSSQFNGPQLDRMDMIQPDAHASMGGVQTGEALQLALPVGDMAEGAQVLRNAAAGKVFQESVAAETALTETNVVQNVTIKTESGVKTVMDVASKDSGGSVALREAKSSATARLTPNQAAAHPEIARTGGTVVGKGKPGFPGGTKIPPTQVKVVRPPGQ
jgi:RHS repeat-associated protein